jgi:hypothetical protein
MKNPAWVNIVNRAVALGVIPYGEGYTVRFTVFHEADCLSNDVNDLIEQGLAPAGYPADQCCNCTPVIMWREACDPIDEFNIIIDKSGSKDGLI